MADVVESKVIELAIDATQVNQQLDTIQKNLAESEAAVTKLGQSTAQALTSIETRLGPIAAGFRQLTQQVQSYSSSLAQAERQAASFKAPNLTPATAPVAQAPKATASAPLSPLEMLEQLRAPVAPLSRQPTPLSYSGAPKRYVNAALDQLSDRFGIPIANPIEPPYEPTLGGPLRPIYPTRTPNAGLGAPISPAWVDEPPIAQVRGEGFDPFGTYGRSGGLREKYGDQLYELKLRRQALEEIKAQQNMVTPEMLNRRKESEAAFFDAYEDRRGNYKSRGNLQWEAQEMVDNLRGGRQGAVRDADFAQNAEKLHDYANALKAAGQGADVYSDGTVKIRNRAGELNTVFGQSKHSVDQLGESFGKSSGLVGALEYSMLRSFAVMGVMWGGISLLSQATEEWVRNTVEADYTVSMMGFTTENTRKELNALTSETMAASAQYGLGPDQSLPSTLLASRAAKEPGDISNLVEGGAKLSVLTGNSQEQATRDIIEIQKKWNMEASESYRIVDVMATALRTSIVDMDQFSESLVRMSAFGRENNLTFEQLAGVMAGFTTATGITDPARGEAFFETIGGLQKRPQDVDLLRQQGIGMYDTNGELLTTMELVNNVAAGWDEMSEQEQKTTVLALVGRQRLNEGLDYFNNYMKQAIATSEEFNNTLGAGNKAMEARGESIKAMWANFWAGVDAKMSDPGFVDKWIMGNETERFFMRKKYDLSEDTEIPNSILNKFKQSKNPVFEGEFEMQREVSQWVAEQRAQVTNIPKPGDANFIGPVRALPQVTPTISASAQNVIDNYGSMSKLKMTGPEFDIASAKAMEQAYASIESTAKQNTDNEQARATMVELINERMNQTVVLYSLQDGQVRTLRADAAALLETEKERANLPSLQSSAMSGGELDSAISRARALAEQYKAAVTGAGFSTEGLQEEWDKTSVSIRTSDGAIRVLTGSAAVFLQQALQIGRAVQTWKPPQLQITSLTPEQYQQQSQVANQLAAQYVQQIQASSLPLEAKQQMLEQIKQSWQQEYQLVMLANGQIMQATGATAAFSGAAGQLTAQWRQAGQAIAQATQIRPNIQTMPELNANTAGQLQQYLVQYENLLNSMGVAQQPQQYMIFGQDGAMYQYITSADAMQLAMALLMEQIMFNTTATEDATDATSDASKVQKEQLRGSYNLPSEWGYRPPTPWEYYDDAKKAGTQVPMGPVNYPWMFPDENGGGGGGGSSRLAKLMAKPHLGMVPTGAGSLLETTFGSKLPTTIDPATQMMFDAANLVDEGGQNILDAANIIAGKDGTKKSLTQLQDWKTYVTDLGLDPKSQEAGALLDVWEKSMQLAAGESAPSPAPKRPNQEDFLADPLHGEGHKSQGFGQSPERYRRFGLAGHEGVDYAAPEGTAVYGAAEGVITKTAYGSDYGYQAWQKLASGAEILYAHLMEMPNLKVGQKVDQDTLIGKVGNTGNSTGPHLHLGYRPGDPLKAPEGFKGWANPEQQLGGTGGGSLGEGATPDISTFLSATATNTQTLATQLPTIMTSVSNNTASLVARVPAGLSGISVNLMSGNLLMAQMVSYLSMISRQVAHPPQVNVSFDKSDFVETQTRRPLPPTTSGGVGTGLSNGVLA